MEKLKKQTEAFEQQLNGTYLTPVTSVTPVTVQSPSTFESLQRERERLERERLEKERMERERFGNLFSHS